MPKLLLVCGPNGAGKSTLTRSLAVRDGMLVIDTDQIPFHFLNATRLITKSMS